MRMVLEQRKIILLHSNIISYQLIKEIQRDNIKLENAMRMELELEPKKMIPLHLNI